jgi:hypothetical protein
MIKCRRALKAQAVRSVRDREQFAGQTKKRNYRVPDSSYLVEADSSVTFHALVSQLIYVGAILRIC